MEILQTVKVEDVVATIELSIANFIMEEIYDDHFGGIPDVGYFDDYDKDAINLCLAEMKFKRLRKVAFAGAALYYMVIGLDVKIHKNAFHFLAFLKDLNERDDEAIALIKSLGTKAKN